MELFEDIKNKLGIRVGTNKTLATTVSLNNATTTTSDAKRVGDLGEIAQYTPSRTSVQDLPPLFE